MTDSPDEDGDQLSTGAQEEIEECPECGGDIISDSGERRCEECGLIVDENQIDHGKDWRSFDAEEEKERSRVGPPVKKGVHDKGLHTEIDWKDKDAHGQQLTAEKRSTMRRLREWQKRIRTKDSSERNLQFAFSEIDRMGSSLGVPRNVRTTASVLYQRALEEDLIRGRSIEGVATAALYAACRQAGVPRSLSDVSAASRVDRREIGRTYRYIKKELGLEIEPTMPQEFIPRYCTELGLSQNVESKARQILEETDDEVISGKDPTGLAASSVYIAALLCDEKITQKEVANVAGVTEVTVRNRYQEQVELLDVYRGGNEVDVS